MKIALVISSLEVGGAESQFHLIALQLKDDGHQVEVWLLRKRGDFIAPLESAGIPVRDLNKQGRLDLVRPTINIRRFARDFLPNAIFCSLPSACLHALAAKSVCPGVVFCWQIVATRSTLPEYGFVAGMGYLIQRLAANFCDHYISNSRAGAISAIDEGYSRSKMHVLQNGIDTARFEPNPDAGKAWLLRNGLDPHRPVIGIVGRLDPAKDHHTFFKAIKYLEAQMSGTAQYVVLGRGSGEHADSVMEEIHALQQQGISIVHVEHETDMPQVYSALNIFTMTSVSEGLPNALLEALACGAFCVATNVGDCAEVIANDGVLVNVNDHGAISTVWYEKLTSAENIADKQVQRVHKKYGLKPMVNSLSYILSRKQPSQDYLL